MNTFIRLAAMVVVVLQVSRGGAQEAARPDLLKPGVLAPADVKTIAPASFYYAGHAASVQLRNTVGIRTPDRRNILAGMVDTSGYSTAIAQRYQGFFITEANISIEGTAVVPGEYGFGFMNDRFILTSVGADDVLNVPSHVDVQMKRPVPIKFTEENGGYRLYGGRRWVALKLHP
jgi:hypothetical protein